VRLKREASGMISAMWSLRRAVFAPPQGLRILMYHAIGTAVPGDSKRLYSISADMFDLHIKTLIHMNQIDFVRVDQTEITGKHLSIAVTFDDGYRDNLHAAAPILRKHGMPFYVFVITEFMKCGSFPYLRADDVRTLAERYGATIGSHSATHARLAECSNSRLKSELVSSKHYLEDVLGREVTHISYPHGSVNQRVRDAAEDAGYRTGMTSRFGINTCKSDRLLLHRVPVLTPDGPRILRQKVLGDWDWYKWRQMF